MKLSVALSILTDLRFAIQVAIFPTLRAILHSPSLLLRPHALSRAFMANLWVAFGPGTDQDGRPTKQRLITPNAYGVVLDLGAGAHYPSLFSPAHSHDRSWTYRKLPQPR